MPVRYAELVQTGDVGGPNPTDAFSLAFELPDTNAAQNDDLSVAFEFPETVAAQADTASLALRSADTIPTVDDLLLRLGLRAADTNAAPADAATFLLRFAAGDTNATPAETARLSISGLGDTNAAPTDARSASLTWTQGAGTATGSGNWSNASNAAGLKDGSSATLSDGTLNNNSGDLTLTAYPDAPADLQGWTVTGVTLRWFASASFSLLSLASFSMGYRTSPGGAWTNLTTDKSNFDALANGRDFDLGALTWAQINGIETRMTYSPTVVTETATLTVDAVHLIVTATKNPL